MEYLKKKPWQFSKFLAYWKRMTTFDWTKEFKIAMVLQSTENKNDKSICSTGRSFTKHRKNSHSFESGGGGGFGDNSVASAEFEEKALQPETNEDDIQWIIKQSREDQM